MKPIRCDEARETLWPPAGPRVADDLGARARAHLEGCAACRAFFRRDARLSRRLEGTRLRTPCPDGMKERILGALAADAGTEVGAPGARGPGRLRPAIPWLVAAAVVLLAAVGILRPGPRDLEAAFVQDYRTRAAAQTAVESPDVDRVSRFFLERVGFEAEPVQVSTGEFRRAQVCFIDGRRAAMVEYRIGGHTVSHYRVPAADRRMTGPVHSATRDGVCIVRWSDGRFAHALVADIPEPELRDLARREFGASP